MKHLRNGKLVDPENDKPDTLVGFVADIYQRFIEAEMPEEDILQLDGIDREFLREMGIEA